MGTLDINKPSFVTCGDVYDLKEETVILGISKSKVSVGDVFILGNREHEIINIKDTSNMDVNEIEEGKIAALIVKKDSTIKMSVFEEAQKESVYNEPIKFGDTSTTLYTFLEFDY